MKICKVETFTSSIRPNVCVVRVTTDAGAIGLGETFYGATSVEAYIHEEAAPALIRLGDVTPEVASTVLATYTGYQGSGAEVRGNSALDMALWDALARTLGIPLTRLLGGPVREDLPTYNTCAGSNYVKLPSRQTSRNWGLPDGNVGPLEDLWGFLHEPGRLAKELKEAGFSGMKVWPFDLEAELAHGGIHADLRPGLRILDEIRSSVGDELDLYVELHSLWGLPGAKRLLRALEEFDPLWVEDPMRADHVDGLRILSESVSVPIAAGESIAGQRGFYPLLEQGVLDFAIVDLGWVGGITEARKVASLAAMFGIPVAPHDCTGPVSLTASVHFALSVPGAVIQEVARSFYYGWYGDWVVGLPQIENGRISISEAPGLGLELALEFTEAQTTRVRTTAS